MSMKIPEQKPPSSLQPSLESEGKKDLEAVIVRSLDAAEANIAQLEQEAMKIVLEAGTGKRPPSSDHAVLSEESRRREVSPEQRKNRMDSWSLEDELELWAALLNWGGKSEASIQSAIDDLFSLYHLLLESVLNHTQGQSQELQLGRLEHALSSALNQLLKQEMAGLRTFFEAYGTKTQMDFLEAGIYRLISGRVLPGRELERFWQAGKAGNGSGAATSEYGGPKRGDSGNLKTGYQPFTQRGVIYGPKGHEMPPLSSDVEARANSLFMKQSLKGQLSSMGQPLSMGQQTGAEPWSPAMGASSALYTAKDLELTERFIRYFIGEGNLLQSKDINGRNEEVLGVLLSISSIKCQVFCTDSGISRPMQTQLQTVFDQMIDTLLQGAERENAGAQRRPGKVFLPLSYRDVYKIYYEIMELYRRYGKPEKAVSEGIRMAIQLFRQKRSDSMFQNTARYDETAGFFRSLGGRPELGKYDLLEDWKEGKRVLERDWQEFMKHMGKPNKKGISLVPEEQSFWGMAAEPAHVTPTFVHRHYLGMLAMTLAMLVLLTLILWLA